MKPNLFKKGFVFRHCFILVFSLISCFIITPVWGQKPSKTSASQLNNDSFGKDNLHYKFSLNNKTTKNRSNEVELKFVDDFFGNNDCVFKLTLKGSSPSRIKGKKSTDNKSCIVNIPIKQAGDWKISYHFKKKRDRITFGKTTTLEFKTIAPVLNGTSPEANEETETNYSVELKSTTEVLEPSYTFPHLIAELGEFKLKLTQTDIETITDITVSASPCNLQTPFNGHNQYKIYGEITGDKGLCSFNFPVKKADSGEKANDLKNITLHIFVPDDPQAPIPQIKKHKKEQNEQDHTVAWLAIATKPDPKDPTCDLPLFLNGEHQNTIFGKIINGNRLCSYSFNLMQVSDYEPFYHVEEMTLHLEIADIKLPVDKPPISSKDIFTTPLELSLEKDLELGQPNKVILTAITSYFFNYDNICNFELSLNGDFKQTITGPSNNENSICSAEFTVHQAGNWNISYHNRHEGVSRIFNVITPEKMPPGIIIVIVCSFIFGGYSMIHSIKIKRIKTKLQVDNPATDLVKEFEFTSNIVASSTAITNPTKPGPAIKLKSRLTSSSTSIHLT
ncbi:MAG: hypothetical protein HRT37_02515 [Alteromonadaceae bacterium]|nr:hypothetical protein [Alteromonadaceae bacterium]